MDLATRLRLALAVVVLLVVGAFLFAFLLSVFAVLLVVGAILALLAYVRLRLFARRVRKAVEQQVRQQAEQAPSPRAGEAIDADFKVEK